MKEIFEWPRLLMNDQPYIFLVEVTFRSIIMFGITFLAFRFSGKRSVKQLSVFEMVLIVSLGSAAGDPMFYEDVGLLPALTVFVMVLLIYRLLTWLVTKNSKIERLIEGQPNYLVKEGKFCLEDSGKDQMAEDEFFSELRSKNIEHLGQVKYAIVETSGQLSVIYYADKEVKPGLPLLPHVYGKKSKKLAVPGLYSCSFCGTTVKLQTPSAICNVCENDEWVASMDTKRIS